MLLDPPFSAVHKAILKEGSVYMTPDRAVSPIPELI